MTRMRSRCGMVLLVLVGAASAGRAGEGCLARPATCAPGYQIVEEVCYQETTIKVCKSVPDVKKVSKVVYTAKPVDYCEPGHCPLHRGSACVACAACADCGRVRTKCVLVKHTVVEECPTTKCVVETTVNRVPYTVYHKVPCATLPRAAPGLDGQAVPHAIVAPAPQQPIWLAPGLRN